MVEGEISFGGFRLNLARRELRRDQTPVRLGSRARDILCVLASAGGKIVTKDELMVQVWAGVVVEENNLQVHISALRRALEKDGGGESWIVTVPGRGYRFLGSPGPPVADNSAPASSSPIAEEPSLAVLPFLNLSGDPEQEYFADGMVEEIITALARIRRLSVIARNSSFAYKGQNVDVKRVGHELGARYVVEGSVRKSANRVRITAQLIDASTGAHLWADRFDGPLEDVFELQDKVASSVAGVIEPALEEAETARSAGRPTTDLTAYDLYLRAHTMVWSSARQIPEALDLLEQAIARDSHYGRALAWAAFCCYRLLLDGRSDAPAIDRLKGTDFAQRALKIAGDDPDVIVNSALARSYFGEDIDAMIALADRLLATACKMGEEVQEAATLLEDALQMVERTGEHWFAPELYRQRGQLLLRHGQSKAAEELYCKALSIAKEQEAKLWELRAAVNLARLRRAQGRLTEARDLLAPVHGWFTEGFDTQDLKEATTLLDELG